LIYNSSSSPIRVLPWPVCPRLVVPNQVHHIIQRGHDKQTIFRDSADYTAFLEWLREGAKRFKLAIHAYVLMDDHIHLLATPLTCKVWHE